MANGMFAGGNGATDNPFLIEDAADLNAIRRNVTACYKLITHINLGTPPYSVGKGWEPINGFIGVLDGNKKKIFNLYINRVEEDNIGLFGLLNTLTAAQCTQMRIIDLAIENAYVNGRKNVGILYGFISVPGGYISEDSANTIIRRVSCSGTASGTDQVGGILGYIYGGGISGAYTAWRAITDSIVKGTVEIRSDNSNYVGGIIGQADIYRDPWGRISATGCTNCISLAKVTNKELKSLGRAVIGGNNSPDYPFMDTNFYDISINADLQATPRTVGLTTEELRNASPKMKPLLETLNGSETIWRIEAGIFPELAFIRTDCFFVKANGNYLTWNAAQKKWSKQFDTLPSTSQIWKLGMDSIVELSTEAWNALKQYGKVEIINFVNQTEKLNVEYSVGTLTKMVDQTAESKICFSKKLLFADYRDDIVSITP